MLAFNDNSENRMTKIILLRSKHIKFITPANKKLVVN